MSTPKRVWFSEKMELPCVSNLEDLEENISRAKLRVRALNSLGCKDIRVELGTFQEYGDTYFCFNLSGSRPESEADIAANKKRSADRLAMIEREAEQLKKELNK